MKMMLVLSLLAGCYQRDLSNCAVSCATTDDCPSGLVCTTAGRCAGAATDSCGGDDTDAPADMPQGDSIRVLALDDRGLPAIGVRVIASAADGSAIAEGTTIADGTIDLPTTVDADVTVVRTNGLGSRMTTIRAVAPGASITFGRRRNEVPSVSRMITWNTDPDATTYFVFTSCGESSVQVAAQGGVTSQSTSITLDPTCANDFDVMVMYSSSTTLQLAFMLKTANTGDVTLDGAFTFFTMQQANLINRPTDVANGNTRFFGKTIFRSADPARGPGSLGAIAGGSGGATAQLALPTAGAVGREIYTTLGHDPDAFARVQQIAERIPPVGEYNLAIEPVMLPWMTTAPVVDLGARTISWSQLSAGPSARTTGDLLAAEITYERGSGDFTWRIIAPPSAAQPGTTVGDFVFAIPDLPGDEELEPRATDTLGSEQHLRNYGFTATLPINYAAIAPTADLAITMEVDLFEAPETFLVQGLGSFDVTRAVVSRFAD